ncbi:transcription factor cwo isoform X2 [Eurosta solidaginis]
MNSCLADLSRLIPPQYQRKGRGRIEKTEIIEMAIRHLKHLQSECIQKESEYRMGYTDCMKEAAKFLYESHMEEFCYRLVARLQEHCVELMKNDCYKSRNCHIPDNVSASSGSPNQAYHTAPPLCQLRDMLGSSDIEHSNDHNDVKDLSFRNHLNQLQRNAAVAAAAATAATNSTNAQAAHELNSSNSQNNVPSNSITSPTTVSFNSATSTTTSTPNSVVVVSGTQACSSPPHRPQQTQVITSTGPGTLSHHNELSQHDYESSSREPLLHTDTSNMHSPPPRDSLLNHHSHLSHQQHTSDSLLSAHMRNYSESSHDIEHNNNYKYKNHIKERFNHELHDEETSSEHFPAPPLLQSEHSHTHSLSEHSKDGTEPEIAPIIAKKRKLAEAAAEAAATTAVGGGVNNNCTLDDGDTRPLPSVRTPTTTTSVSLIMRDEKPFSFAEIKTELSAAPTSFLNTNKTHMSAPSSTTHVTPSLHAPRSFAVPIFALHGQGTYYVPLNVDYNVLVPFLNGADLLEKNYASMPVVHPININVNFMTATPLSAAAVAAGKQQLPLTVNGAINSTASVTAADTAAAVAKAKLENISNGW